MSRARRRLANHDESKTGHRICVCGHRRDEHEVHPDEHCYQCRCAAFRWLRLTKFQLSLLREARLKGAFSSYMVPNKSIVALATQGLIVANEKSSWFKTSRFFEITSTGRACLEHFQEVS